MGLFGTSNDTLATQIGAQQQTQFKAMNNLLTLQENHVEDFFQYHGEAFLGALEKLIEDTVARTVSQMLVKLEFSQSSSGNLSITPDALSDFTAITQENIDLDIQQLLATAVNSEVVMQRRMAKQQYLEAQGFSSPQQPQQTTTSQMGMNNGSGYPIPPSGYDNMNNPYWIDPQTGQPTYTPPQSGLGLAQGLGKAVAWAKWLA